MGYIPAFVTSSVSNVINALEPIANPLASLKSSISGVYLSPSLNKSTEIVPQSTSVAIVNIYEYLQE